MPPQLDHLFVTGFTKPHDFKSTLSVRKASPPQRPRAAHGARLLDQLGTLARANVELNLRRAAQGLPEKVGITLAIEVSPPGSLDYAKQLEWKRDRIEVLNAHKIDDKEVVLLHVPEGKLKAFEDRVRDFLEKDSVSRSGQAKPKNAALINAISAIREAAFRELWTDESLPPDIDQVTWFQIWLRAAGLPATQVRETFQLHARSLGIEVDAGYLLFPGRVVVAARGTRRALEEASQLLDQIAEIRNVATTAEFFLSDLRPFEQAEWVRELLARSTFPAGDESPAIALLDTGVNAGHPLLSPLLGVNDQHAVDAAWQAFDHDGHGTAMAGLATHGNLTPHLSSTGPNDVPHRLESVKILPPTGQNPPHLYGWVTSQAVDKVEQAKPNRLRTFACMTTASGATTGLPTEWSAAIDRMAYGMSVTSIEEAHAGVPRSAPRLFVLAAGNVPWPQWANYPTSNLDATIESPGQAWNALTVGACTDLTDVDSTKWSSLNPLALKGGMSPSSTTSIFWNPSWPFKPDVVAEGGNGSRDAAMANQAVVGPESLRLLTTAHDLAASPFCESGDTSAATAEVARICGHLHAHYPTYWPETIRALVVHGARYSFVMRSELPLNPVKSDKQKLLRQFGYGQVSLNGSMFSDRKRATLVLQEQLTPYELDGSAVKLGKLNMHALPWPSDVLAGAPDATVELRITLSYFVEPNPSRRGWQSKFRYQSHGLRFAVKGATETTERFAQRINKLERDAADTAEASDYGDADNEQWFFRPQLRSRGSIHSDFWRGTAAQLAEKSHVAVFPVGGWWKDWKDSDRHDNQVRYSLVVTLEVLDDVDVDLYTPIATTIGIQVPPVAVA